MTADTRPTAAVVVIGNEVLSGKVVDQNTSWLIGRFRELGVRLRRVTLVPDDHEAIGATVAEAAAAHDLVVTTGGVGPTHDDITIDAIARGFGVAVVEDPTLGALVRSYFGAEAGEAHLRLARVPEGSQLVGEAGPPWPTIRFRNVFILPGIPRLMAAKFDAIAPLFGGQDVWCGAVTLVGQEADVCEALDRVVAAHPGAQIGSYPRKEEGRWLIRLTAEGVSRPDVEAALGALAAAMGDRVLAVEAAALQTRRPA